MKRIVYNGVSLQQKSNTVGFLLGPYRIYVAGRPITHPNSSVKAYPIFIDDAAASSVVGLSVSLYCCALQCPSVLLSTTNLMRVNGQLCRCYRTWKIRIRVEKNLLEFDWAYYCWLWPLTVFKQWNSFHLHHYNQVCKVDLCMDNPKSKWRL